MAKLRNQSTGCGMYLAIDCTNTVFSVDEYGARVVRHGCETGACGAESDDDDLCMLSAGHEGGHVDQSTDAYWLDRGDGMRCGVAYDNDHGRDRVCARRAWHPGIHSSSDYYYMNEVPEPLIDQDPTARYPHSLTEAPEHYRGSGGMQPWDVIEAFGLDYWRGNVIRYVLRAGRKDDEIQDLKKARDFLNKIISLRSA